MSFDGVISLYLLIYVSKLANYILVDKLTYIDLFAGCGGLSLGLFNSGKWQGLFAIEKSDFAFSTLEHNLIEKKSHFNWPYWFPVREHDINQVLIDYEGELNSLAGTIDLVVGGPPCQGFSSAGKRLEKDERNQLFESYLRFVELVQPKALLFENVKGFDIGFKQGEDQKRGIPYSKLLIKRLEELGYSGADYEVLNFKNYGVPQSRERVIVVASKDFEGKDFFSALEQNKKAFLEKKGLGEKVTLRDAISDLLMANGTIDSPDSKGFQAGVYGEPQSCFQHLMRKGYQNQFPDSHRFANHTPEILEKFAVIVQEKLTSKQVQAKFKTKKTRTKLLSGCAPSQTLTTLPDDYIHYCEPRILTVREYARIQSFNDWYEIKKKYTTGGPLRKTQVPRYSQVGNAVPPLFAELAGNVLHNLSRNGRLK